MIFCPMLRRLRRLRKFRGIYRDVYAGRASSAAFTETFAQVAQVPRHLPRRLRELPQTPKSFPRRLRGSRKHQKVSRETCGTPANTKNFFERLAGLPQTPKSFPRRLRDSRKHQKVSREACGTPANTKKFLGVLAEVPQTPTTPSKCQSGGDWHFF